ncbi:unnamed protein product [Linum tenue]|uniref:Non-haem dioxygenase N-terminal domain-containing protein n=1 Tax=Linum tenue TaxID=586396 RepID=A0AAV0KIS7_9ROSI|nr:unnamed protein product [Linum tenue]
MASIANESSAAYDRLAELKAFNDTKAGVKGLVDSGITHLPRIFHFPPHLLDNRPSIPAGNPNFTFPVIDLNLDGVNSDSDKRNRVVEKIRDASSNWGFFQVVNHGIPETLLDEMKAGVHKFHDQTVELKKQFYGRDPTKKVYYNSNFDLFDAPAASWRDSGAVPRGARSAQPRRDARLLQGRPDALLRGDAEIRGFAVWAAVRGSGLEAQSSQGDGLRRRVADRVPLLSAVSSAGAHSGRGQAFRCRLRHRAFARSRWRVSGSLSRLLGRCASSGGRSGC